MSNVIYLYLFQILLGYNYIAQQLTQESTETKTDDKKHPKVYKINFNLNPPPVTDKYQLEYLSEMMI